MNWLIPTHKAWTPRGLILRAAMLAVLFAAVQLAGFREYTSVLCGMYPAVGAHPQIAAFWGFVYIALYLTFTLLAPILLITAALLALWNRSRPQDP